MRRDQLITIFACITVIALLLNQIPLATLVAVITAGIAVRNTLWIPYDVKEIADAAYNAACDHTKPTDAINVPRIWLQAYEEYRKGLQPYIPGNENAEAPKRILLGRPGRSVRNPKKGMFFPVATVNQKGLRYMDYPEMELPRSEFGHEDAS